MIGIPTAKTNNVPNTVCILEAMTQILNKMTKKVQTNRIAPIAPYSSTIIAKIKSDED